MVNFRLAFRRHLTLIRSSNLVRRTTADGQPRDEIVPLVGDHLEWRVAAYRRSQRHRGPTGPPGASVSDTGEPSAVSVVSSVVPVGSTASAVPPPSWMVPAVSALRPAGYRSLMDSSDEESQAVGTADSASDLFADLSPRAQARLDDLTDWFKATEGAPPTSVEAESRGVPGRSPPLVGGPSPGRSLRGCHPWSGGPQPRASPRASGRDLPSTADAEAQADLRAGEWRPNFSLTRAAQLVASPAQVGRRVARLMGLSAQDFVSNDLIEAIATGIAQYERDSVILLITQLGSIAAQDGTGICVERVLSMASAPV